MNLTNNEIHYLRELVEQDIKDKPSIDNHEKKRWLLTKLHWSNFEQECDHEYADDDNGVMVCGKCGKVVFN